MRPPLQVEVHLSDLNTRSALVKGAEDLRVDQRVQQLFDTMNALLAHDAGEHSAVGTP